MRPNNQESRELNAKLDRLWTGLVTILILITATATLSFSLISTELLATPTILIPITLITIEAIAATAIGASINNTNSKMQERGIARQSRGLRSFLRQEESHRDPELPSYQESQRHYMAQTVQPQETNFSVPSSPAPSYHSNIQESDNIPQMSTEIPTIPIQQTRTAQDIQSLLELLQTLPRRPSNTTTLPPIPRTRPTIAQRPRQNSPLLRSKTPSPIQSEDEDFILPGEALQQTRFRETEL